MLTYYYIKGVNFKEIRIKCKDGFELAGTVFEPDFVKGAVMIAPATGVKQRFYKSFASYLAENNYGVITFENRGIGGSKNGSINNINASLINWGELDMSAVLAELIAIFPRQKYHLVGHSAGGQLVGLMHNATKLDSMFNFAASSGNLRNMNYPFKFTATFFLNYFIPLSNFFFGKANSQWVGMGEPLPKKVASQWTRWCNGAGYVATDFGKEIKVHKYDKLTFPSMWLHATDDGIANLENVNDMVRVYSKTTAEIITLNPKELSFIQIGHMNFFSSKYKVLWQYSLDWLKRFD